jgi:hypothetical protein
VILLNDFFYLHIKKAGGQSIRAALSGYYVETNRYNTTPFVALPKKEWNDNLNNYRIPLGDYDYKRMLFAKNFLYSKKDFNNMFKFTIVRDPFERAVSSFLYLSKNIHRYKLLTKINKKNLLKYF